MFMKLRQKVSILMSHRDTYITNLSSPQGTSSTRLNGKMIKMTVVLGNNK